MRGVTAIQGSKALTPPLALREREQTEFAARPTLGYFRISSNRTALSNCPAVSRPVRGSNWA